MNIDEVLLTEKQKEHLIAEALSDNPHWQPDAWGLFDVICKAQCLKLLEWLHEEDHIEHQLFVDKYVSGVPLMSHDESDCWLCELESKLKENHD